MELKERTVGVLQVILGATLFGLIPMFVRFGQSINTFSLVFFRAFFGMVFIYLIIKLSGKTLTKFKEERTKLIAWAVVLLFTIGSYFIALKLIDIASTVLLMYSYSVFIVLFSKFWLKEKIHTHTLAALILSIIGIILIISPSGFKFQGNSIGYLFAISTGFFGGLNFMFPKKYFKKYDTYSLTFYQNLWMLPMLVIFVLLYPPDFTLKNIGIFASLGLFCTALAFFFVYTGSRKIHGQYIGILQTTEVIVPIILGIIIFSEIPYFITIIGGILLITGNLIIVLKESKWSLPILL